MLRSGKSHAEDDIGHLAVPQWLMTVISVSMCQCYATVETIRGFSSAGVLAGLGLSTAI